MNSELFQAVSNRNNEFINQLPSQVDLDIRSETGDTLLISAIRNNYTEILESLLNKGANPNLSNDRGLFPLHFAVQQENFECVRLLISKGAQVNQKDGQFGNTPLFIAIMKVSNPENFVRILIENGADPEVENNMGVSPTKVALRKGIKLV